MTWIFSLSAECGENQQNAVEFSHNFEQKISQSSQNLSISLSSSVFQDSDENWWGRIYPQSLSQQGINSPEDAYLMTELGLFLYQCLQSIAGFRYALVGIEVDEFRTYNELLENPTDIQFHGLVISQELWEMLEKPAVFCHFSEGYVWKPSESPEFYSGERQKLFPVPCSLLTPSLCHNLFRTAIY